MTTEEIVRTVLKQNGMKIKELAEAVGMQPQGVRDRISRHDSITVYKLTELLDKMGCELIIRDKTRGCDYHVDGRRGS